MAYFVLVYKTNFGHINGNIMHVGHDDLYLLDLKKSLMVRASSACSHALIEWHGYKTSVFCFSVIVDSVVIILRKRLATMVTTI